MKTGKYKRIVRNSIIVAFIFIAAIFFPGIAGIDGMDGGFAISFIAGFAAIMAFVTAGVYNKMAKQEASILSGKDLLAHWKYSDNQWNEYAEQEYITDKKNKTKLFYIVAAFSAFFGILFPILDDENGIYVTYVMIGLIGLIGLVAWLSIRSSYNRNIKNKGEAYISRNGVILNGQLHAWKILGSKFISVTYYTEERPPILEFIYEAFQGRQRGEYSFRVPVPPKEEKTAMKIIQELNIGNVENL